MIRVGTRGSALALWQARHIAAPLGGETEIVTITTAGDRGEGIGDKARWTSALERALLAGEIDVAVHSAKDVPGEIAPGTVVAAIPARANALDAICGAAGVASLGPGARVGTSSLRRAAQLRALREDIEVVELRGNVDTRLRKLAEGQADAIILAAAGLERLEREDAISGYLTEFVPAPGQGALLIQARADDRMTLAACMSLRDEAAERCVMAERALAASLGATCTSPLGAAAVPAAADDTALPAGRDRAHAVPASDTEVTLRGWDGLPDGSQ